MNLMQIGWNEFFEKQFRTCEMPIDKYPARVFRTEKQIFHLMTENGMKKGSLTGKFLYEASDRKDFPSVGDWVIVEETGETGNVRIKSLLKRKTCFSRKEKISGGRKVITLGNKSTTAGGATQEQVISANIDIVFIVTALDNDFNLRKLERFLIPVKKSGASPVIVLNKTDLCGDVETLKLSVIKNFSKVPVIEISALEKTGLERLKDFINEGITISFLGSSGVGKSTIINALMDEERLLTGEVSGKDSLGRHTTTWRETVILPNGGILIDNPGLRILKLFAEEDDVKDTFGDIEKIISECRFANCTHNGEPGCALKKALDNGEIDIQRYENYIFMKAEASYIEGRKKERDRKKDRKKKNNDKNGFEIKNKSSKKIRYEDI